VTEAARWQGCGPFDGVAPPRPTGRLGAARRLGDPNCCVRAAAIPFQVQASGSSI